VRHNLSDAVEYAHIHLFGVQIDSALVFVLFGVKSHLASSLVGVDCFLPRRLYHRLEEALHGIKGMHPDSKPRGAYWWAFPGVLWLRGLVPVMPGIRDAPRRELRN